MRMVFDLFPIALPSELDILEIRLNELAGVVDKHVIVEAGETFGGDAKPFVLTDEVIRSRFAAFAHKIVPVRIAKLYPQYTETGDKRTIGWLREVYQRNALALGLLKKMKVDDVIILSDCDEIPRAKAVREWLEGPYRNPSRFAMDTYYYNVSCLTDRGHDFAARARIGEWSDVWRGRSIMAFRFLDEVAVIPNGGFQFSYFGGTDAIRKKVATMNKYLDEYKLFDIEADVRAGRDIHHRDSELPKQFERIDNNTDLPEYLLKNKERFKHFWSNNE